MNWTVLGVVSQLVAAAGIIVSLFYLAQQIRQSTRATMSATYQSIVANVTSAARAVIDNADMAEIFVKGADDPDALSPEERARFNLLASSWFRHYDGLYTHYCTGMLEEQQLEAFRRYLTTVVRIRGMVVWWHENSRAFTESFQAFVDELIALERAGSHDDAV